MEQTNRKIVTVSQIGVYIKRLIESDGHLRNIFIKGEISNFVHHKAGHLYFDLKDEGGVLNAVMFASSAKNLTFQPENGMMVIVCGRITSYERGSRYQIIVGSIEMDGIGSLYIAFEQLKAKLQREGLFDPAHKKPIPKIPTRCRYRHLADRRGHSRYHQCQWKKVSVCKAHSFSRLGAGAGRGGECERGHSAV